MPWELYHEGADPKLDKIVRRRFGPEHEKPCSDPAIITCAMWECQVRNRCRKAKRKSRKAKDEGA